MISFIFGIEKEFLNKISKKESSLYFRLSLLFIFIVLSSFISGSYLSFMVYKNLPLNIVTGFLFGFIYFSLLRFSLCSVEQNIHEPNSSTNNKIKRGGFKYVVFVILASFISLPLSSLILRPFYLDQIQENKISVISDYKLLLENNLKNRLEVYDEKISLLESKKSYQTSTDFESLRIDNLIIERDNISNSTKLKNKVRIDNFYKEISSSDQLLFHFREISTSPIGSVIIFLVNFAFYTLLKKTYFLVYDDSFDYSRLRINYYKNFIDKELEINYSRCSNILKEKYNYDLNYYKT